MFLSFLLQITPSVGDTLATVAQTGAAPVVDSLSLLDLILKGGYLMIPIGVLSLISIFVLIERYITIKKAGKIDRNFMNTIKDFIHNGNLEAAKALSKNAHHPVGVVIGKGLSRLGKPVREIESSMESVGKIEIAKLEKNLSVLGIIAGIAPMFGFIGTISGVIKIFYNISLADNISIGLISGGLYEKMITSAAGLVVGVFSFVSYHYLNIMLDKLIVKVETSAVEFMDIINEPGA
jgi:biopolymer transport protein ExbB